MSTLSFLIKDASTGGTNPTVRVTIEETSPGVFTFKVEQVVTDNGCLAGDLRGLFFDVGSYDAKALAISGYTALNQQGAVIQGISTTSQLGADSLKDLGGGVNMNGLLGTGTGTEARGFDAGIAFGTEGIGKDDVFSVSFQVTGPNLTLANFANVDFGARITSVGTVTNYVSDTSFSVINRTASSKIIENTLSLANSIDHKTSIMEDANEHGNLLGDAVANKTLLCVSCAGEMKDLANSTSQTFSVLDPDGKSVIAVVAISKDGSYTIDTQGADCLAEGQTVAVEFDFSYKQTEGLDWSTVDGKLKVLITGTNDAPVVSGAVAGSAVEDGTVSTLNALAHALDVDAGAVLDVVDIPALLPAGVSYDAAARSFSLDPGVAAYQSLAQGQTAEVTVKYGVSDGFATTPAEVTWTVTGVDEPVTNTKPVVAGETILVSTGLAPYQIPLNWLLGNDPDPDGDSISISSIVKTSGSAWSVSTVTDASGKVTALNLEPAPSSAQTHTWTYTVSDGKGGQTTGTLTINTVETTTGNGTVDKINLEGLSYNFAVINMKSGDDKGTSGSGYDVWYGGQGIDTFVFSPGDYPCCSNKSI